MNDTFMKEKPVFPLILSMALPMVISMLVNSLYNIVDSFFVAQIRENAMTALSLVYPIQNFANAIAIGFGIGISAQIAICLGAGNRRNCQQSCNSRACIICPAWHYSDSRLYPCDAWIPDCFLLLMRTLQVLESVIPRLFFCSQL